MQKVQEKKMLDTCPECGGKKSYREHYDDDYEWKCDDWTCECGAKGFDAYRMEYSAWEVD